MISAFSLILANSTGGAGTYNLSGTGCLSVGSLEVGNSGNATANQSGGTVTIGLGIDIGILTSNSTYNISAGNIAFIGSSAVINVGKLGNGNFNQTGGNFNFAGGSLFLASGSSSSIGSYTLANSAVMLNAGIESIGRTGTGHFIQTGGNNTLSGDLEVGESGTGTYTLSATTGPGILAAKSITVGDLGTGTFTQNGGSVSLSGDLGIGAGTGSAGSYTINSGTLSVADIYVGEDGKGNYTQNGGSVSLFQFLVGGGVAASTFSLTNGNITAQFMIVGEDGSLATASQSGGNIILTEFTVGQNGGTYALTNGNLSASSDEAVGRFSANSALFTQSGGINATNLLKIGELSGSTGKYQMNAGNLTIGTLTSVGTINVGLAGNGNITQAGGNVTITSPPASLATLDLADGPITNGSYSMTNGNLTIGLSNGALIIARGAGGGTFTQSGGNVTVNGSSLTGGGITIGGAAGGQGSYFLSAGLLSAGSIVIGAASTGTFSQSGGAATFGSNSSINPTGTLFLSSNGVLNLTASTGQFLITSGGNFFQFGGTLNGFLTNNGNVSQSNGTFNAYLTNAGTFTYTAGIFNGTYEHDFTGTLIWPGLFFAGGGILNKGTLTIPTNFSLSVGTLGIDAFDNESILLLTGGATSGTGPLINNGSISGFGTIAGFGGLNNNAVISFNNGTLILNNIGINTNSATILGSPGNTLQIDSNLNNIGSITLSGGTLTGAGTLTNSISGTLGGFGTLSITTFNNAGGTLYAQGGTLHLTNPITNAGIIQVALSSTLNGAPITNNNSIQGAGTIANSITNTASIEPINGTLTLTAPLINSPTGTLYSALGNKLLLLGGLATNAGTINLSGGTFDNNNLPLNNTGSILGYGTFRTGNTGLTNSGSILFAGGCTTIIGNVINTASHTLEVRNTPALFTSPVTNNAGATFKTTTTTATFASTFTNNGTYTSDPATNIFQNNITNAGLMTDGPGDIFNFTTGAVTNSGNFTNGGTLISSDNFTNSGNFTQSGPQTWTPNSSFTNTAGTATFASNAKLYSLTITGGTVDITSSQIIVEATANKSATLTALRADITNHSLTSSTLPSTKTIVISDNAIAQLTNFGGTTNLDSNSILLTAAYKGDANLDGTIDIQDLTTLANHWQQPATDWSQGDFDNNGIVNIQDLTAVANNWQAGLTAGGGSSQSFSDALAQIRGLTAPTPAPEPASLTLLLPFLPMLLKRPFRRPIFRNN